MLMRGVRFVGWIAILGGLGACSADAYVGSDFFSSPSGGGGVGEDGPACAGVCLPNSKWGWEGPVALWVGKKAEQPDPACAAAGWFDSFTGYLEPEPQPLTCPQCACDLPSEVCTPGTGWKVHSEVGCAGTATDFSAPAGWDGTCTEENAIPEGELCDGKPCVQSVLIPPPELSSCVVRVDMSNTEEMDTFPSAQSVMAEGCDTEAMKGVCSPGGECRPTLPQGFMACVHEEGDHQCLDEDYPNRHLLYGEYVDTRGCTECTCGTPMGAKCSIAATAHNDAVCAAFGASTTIGTAAPALCVDVMQGIALGSKSAKIVSATPGVCEPPTGGEPFGELKMGLPRTFCCR